MIARMKGWVFALALLVLHSPPNAGNAKQVPHPPPAQHEEGVWLTLADCSKLLERQAAPLVFSALEDTLPTVQVDDHLTYQTMEGFGYTLTGGSAMLIQRMSEQARRQLLEEFFSCKPGAMCIRYLRISIGASDLEEQVFTYNDVRKPDPRLAHFSLSRDTLYLIPLLQQIRYLYPDVKIMATPWSAPAWMKTNRHSIGGRLRKRYYPTYAQYLVRYIAAMRAHGIPIDAVTIQNEPLHGGNNPSMKMSAAQQTAFIRDHLGPAFRNAGIATKIIVWDHNCDHPEYPIQVLNDPQARRFIDGSAFHLYAGDIAALSVVHQAHPDKRIYFTEQWTAADGHFGQDLMWHVKNVLIGACRHWAVAALEWNLANDPAYKPHTPGGCTKCKGAVTIDGDTIVKNVSWYVIAQAASFVPPGSVRISSEGAASLPHVAFLRPDGKKVLLVLNEGTTSYPIHIAYQGQKAALILPPASVATCVW